MNAYKPDVSTAVATPPYVQNYLWFMRDVEVSAMTAVPLLALEYMLAKDADSMPLWKSDSDFRRVRAAIVALVCGTALQGFGDWLWLAIKQVTTCS